MLETQIDVDTTSRVQDIRRIWTSLGYDEINWSATPQGKRNFGVIRDLAEHPYYVRAHNLFNTGTARGTPHYGSGNVYHEDADGNPIYDWSVIDPIFDTWVESNCRPLVELAFTPRSLVPSEAKLPYQRLPSMPGEYEAGLWAFPPRDYSRWADLVRTTVDHFTLRYGADQVETWYWELWNEPDISYWQGTPEQYFALYDFTAAAVKEAFPSAQVGGPATTHRGVRFLESFLDHCAKGNNARTGATGAPLDFISFHTKGAAFPRTYGPHTKEGVIPERRASPNIEKMLVDVREMLSRVAEHGAFRDLPVLVDECDASVPAHWTIYDNANFGYRNTAYYAVFQCQQMKKLLDLDQLGLAKVHQATTWSWHFEGERYFEGTRSLFTTNGIEKPVLNAYRLLGKLGDERLAVQASHGWSVDQLEKAPPLDAPNRDAGIPEGAGSVEVDALATVDPTGRVCVLVWHFADDQYRRGEARVEVNLRGLSFNGPVTLRRWRVDVNHSNSYAAWLEAGRPQDPSPAQLAYIKARQGLALEAPPCPVEVRDGELRLALDLSLPSVVLLELGPTNAA